MTLPETDAKSELPVPFRVDKHRRTTRHWPRITRWCLTIGIVIGVLIVIVMGPALTPQPSAPKGLQLLWYLSIVLLVFGMGCAILDERRLTREWKALDCAERNRVAAARKWPQSIVVARIDWVDAAIAEQHASHEFRQANRVEAAVACGLISTVTRFLSSALLVLAVMGTFAGMKTALPPLIDAIKAASSDLNLTSPGAMSAKSGSAPSDKIGEALSHVADAFGANLAALFGSLILGAAAFGTARDKRRFLADLEQISEDRLYRLLPPDANASELQRVVVDMRHSVSEIANALVAFSQLPANIADLRGTLRETLSELHTSFSDSVQQHSIELGTRLNSTVTALTGKLAGVTQALELTAAAYEGLVKGLQERDLGVQQAASELALNATRFDSIAERLDKSAAVAANANTRASDAIGDAQQLHEAISAEFHRVVQSLSQNTSANVTAVATIAAGMEEEFKTLGGRAEALGETLVSEHQRGAALISANISTSLASATDQASALLRGIGAQTQTSVEQLEAIRSALATRPPVSEDTGMALVSALAELRSEMQALRREISSDVPQSPHSAHPVGSSSEISPMLPGLDGDGLHRVDHNGGGDGAAV